MKYKLMAVDMDGTLLNHNREISKTNLDAIHKAVEQGLHFVIASGRPVQGVQKFQPQLQLQSPMIVYNGAMIVTPDTQEVLFECVVEAEDARQILRLSKEYQTTVCVWSKNQLYVRERTERVKDYEEIEGVPAQILEDEEQVIEQGITKVIWYDDEDKIACIENELSNTLFHSVTFCTSQPFFLEFFNQKVSKGVAVQKLAEQYHLSAGEVIAVGDGFNDVSMIEYAGLGVAMANAPQAVKDKAQYITVSNDEDGIAKVLKEFLKFPKFILDKYAL
jgi:hypothetical protein